MSADFSNQVWTQDQPTVPGVYWKRGNGYPECVPEPVRITETDLDTTYGKLSMHRTPKERRDLVLAFTAKHTIDKEMLKLIEDLPEEHWQMWWCGPLNYPAF